MVSCWNWNIESSSLFGVLKCLNFLGIILIHIRLNDQEGRRINSNKVVPIFETPTRSYLHPLHNTALNLQNKRYYSRSPLLKSTIADSETLTHALKPPYPSLPFPSLPFPSTSWCLSNPFRRYLHLIGSNCLKILNFKVA